MFADPFVDKMLGVLPNVFKTIIGFMFIIIFILDMIYSWIVAFNLRNNIIIVEDLKNKKLNELPDLLEESLKEQIKKIKRIPKRIMKVFPNFISNYTLEFDIIEKLKKTNKKFRRKSRRKK